MATIRRIYQNTLAMGAAEIFSKAAQFAVMILAARTLTQDDFGIFNYALALSFIFTILSDFGVNTLLIRDVARNKRKTAEFFTKALIVRSCLSLLVCILSLLFIFFMGYSSHERAILLLILLFAIVAGYTDFLYSMFRAFERMGFDASLKVFRMASIIALYALLFHSSQSAIVLALIFLLSEMLTVIVGSILLGTHLPNARIEKKHIRISAKSLLSSWAFGLSIIFGSIYFFIGPILLSILSTNTQVALYSSAYNILLALLFIPAVYTNAIYPVLSRLHLDSREHHGVLAERSFKYLALLGIGLSAFLFTFSSQIIHILYGTTYALASPLLKVASLFLCFKFLNFLLGTVLSSQDGQIRRTAIQGAACAISVLLHLLFISRFGAIGASYALLVTEIVLFIGYFSVSSLPNPLSTLSTLLRPLIASLIAFFLIPALPFLLESHALTQAASAAASYAAILLLIGAFDAIDCAIVQKAMQRSP